jgi:penicillin-binding protein 2
MKLRRSHIIQATVLLIGTIFLARLLFIQVLSEEYALAAEKNIVQPVVEYPYRGVIYDRHGELLVCNTPIYDLMVIPKEVKRLDIQAFCQDFKLCAATFAHSLTKAKAYSYVKPSVFIKNICEEQWASIQDRLSEYPGFFVQVRTVRQYPLPILANTFGYIGEINPQQLAADTVGYYAQGDMVGISGLEKMYEEALRGQRGVRYKVSDARGIVKGSFKEGALDQASTPGQNLKTTIDRALQVYGERLMEGKLGSIVAIDPQTGEVLALVSSPTYDPNLLAGGDFSKHFGALEQESCAPLFHRPIMAMYPPGSIFKLNQALIALQEKVLRMSTAYACDKRLLNCHPHPSPLRLKDALKYSCNPYFYHVFRNIIGAQVSTNAYETTRIGLEKWCGYLKSWGLGRPLGIDLPGEKSGCVPDSQFYDKWYGKGRWKTSTIRSLDIGQGELLITPLQMANFAAVVANSGYYHTPHLVKQIGEEPALPKEEGKHELVIDNEHFEFIADAMQESVEGGTSWRARTKGIVICAKTGTVENLHGPDHAVCIAFSPRENPKIAIAVYVENAGWGSRAAASIAGLLIEQHIKGEITRPWLENYVLKGDFFH